VHEPFTGGPTTRVPEQIYEGYPAGLALGRKHFALGTSTDDGTTIWVTQEGDTGMLYANSADASVAALSEDEQLLSIEHSEHGDSRHPALRVLRVRDGSTVAEKFDGPGKGLQAIEFAPVAGDERLLVSHERNGREELLVWDVTTDTETLIELDLPGELSAGFYPDGAALLVVHTHSARDTLHRYDLATGELSTVHTATGSIAAAGARQDGSIEYSWSNAATPSLIRSLALDGADTVLLTPPGERAPGSAPLRDARIPGTGGEIHALYVRPEIAPDAPLPTVFAIHGGPQAADEDRFSAYRAVWLDAGFAVVHVNYRGSSGYGSAWRDAIEGRPGLTELEDVACVCDWAISSGLSTADQCVIDGASWGGYLTLLALGVQPQRWAAGIGVVPVADYLAAYADEMEPLRAFDRALFGGSPEQLPELYARCSPHSYVESVRAPLLVVAGENDPRCPIRQIENYLDALAKTPTHYEVYRYDAGHGSLVVAETVKQAAIEVDFARRMLGLH
ncbi:MAG: prolyl oligopeptidase family serine peptidase, partial [Sciscionella sp.]